MQSIRELRKEIQDNLDRFGRLKQSAYSNFYKVINTNNVEDKIFISWEQLRTLKVNERVVFDDVEFLKLSENENEMVFNTIMVAGGKFKSHFHDCIEICKVLVGKMIETQKDKRLTTKIYDVGDRAIYDIGEEHEMLVDEYTLLEVRFLKEI